MLIVQQIIFFIFILTGIPDSESFQKDINGNDSTVVMPSLFPEFDVNFGEIRYIRSNPASSSNSGIDPNILLLVGNELYWLTEKSVDIIGVFTDSTFTRPQNKKERLKIGEIQVDLQL